MTADAAYGLDITPRVEAGVPRDAVEVLRDAIDRSPSAPTVVTLGPLTNLEDAFAADQTLPDRVALIHAMLGTVDAPGNVSVDGQSPDDPLEWNAFADPSAVAAVFATDVPIDLVPLDATRDVPVPPDLTERLATDHAAGGADIMYELLLRNPSRLAGDEGQQLWDELAALALGNQDLVTWSDGAFIVGDGGRLTADPAGRPVRYASAADRPAVEAALLAALRRGAPRATPFQFGGTLTGNWNGATCVLTAEITGPGLYDVTYTGRALTPSGLLIAGVRPPHAWAELVGFLEAVDLSSEVQPPDWIIEAGEANDESGTGALISSTTDLEAGIIYGPVCVTGQWPDLMFTPGEPFEIAP